MAEVTDGPWLPVEELSREDILRIEALRAASRLLSRLYSGAEGVPTMGAKFYSDATIDIAEQFARWLETGER